MSVDRTICSTRSPNLQFSRRALLRGSLLAAFGSTALASSHSAGSPLLFDPSIRVISLDNGLTQMALSVGVVPIGVSRPSIYRRLAVEPTLPEGIIDLGESVSEPNLELLRTLKPDLILVNQGIAASSGGMLARVASLAVPSRGFQMLDEDPFEASVQEHRATCEAINRVREGKVYRDGVVASIDGLRSRARSLTSRPILILSGIDRRHTSVLVRNNIFQAVLDQLGLMNAWQGVAMPLGMSVVGLEQIAPLEDATIVAIEGTGNLSEIMASPLWQALRPVRERRVISLPPMWTVGGLPVAERFARHLVPALERLEAWHG